MNEHVFWSTLLVSQAFQDPLLPVLWHMNNVPSTQPNELKSQVFAF